MAQTVCTRQILSGKKIIVLKKPPNLHRIFFSVRVLVTAQYWYDVRMSFDDPSFSSFYMLQGPDKYFEAEGEDIFQGNIWVRNSSDKDLLVTLTEILH